MSIVSSIYESSQNFLSGIVNGSYSTTGDGVVLIPKLTTPEGLKLIEDTPETETGSTTGTGSIGTQTSTEPFNERLQVLERIRSSTDLDPAAKSRILLLAASRPNLTAYDLRVMFATCLYPSAQGLPAPEGYEYFLSLIEKGATVTEALSDARIYFKADAVLTGDPGDPNAPDTQENLISQGRIIAIVLVIFAFLIIRA